jgi:lipoprotein
MNGHSRNIPLHVIIMCVLPLAGSTSCNNDEPQAEATPEETIAFFDPELRSPVTTQTISEFKVWAMLGNWTPVMKGVTVTRKGPNSWGYSPTVKWPDEAVSFYAVSPASTTMSDIYLGFNIYYKCRGDIDLLVAVRKDVHQTDGRIKLNFCHTLSRITASISTPLTDTVVDVKRISLADVGDAGTFTVPDRTTVINEPAGDISDRWQVWSMTATNFNLFYSTDSFITLSGFPYSPVDGSEFMIPVHLTPLEFSGYIHGSAIRVVYRLINRKTGETIWPTSTTPAHLRPYDIPGWGVANLALKQSTPDGRWLAGREYHYNISIIGEPSFNGYARSGRNVTGSAGCIISCTDSEY